MVHVPRLCASFLAAIEVLAKPWNGVIMAALEDGPFRFRELGERVPAIGDRMLAARLKELEARGLVVRCVENGPPVRVNYHLSETGRGYRDVADALEKWGKTMVQAQSVKPQRKQRGKA